MDHEVATASPNRERLERRVDRLERAIDGEKDTPGLHTRVNVMENILFGKTDKPQDGLVYKVLVMWRAHLWILCLASGACGFGLREAIKAIFKV